MWLRLFFKLLAVLPFWLRRGIGTALVLCFELFAKRRVQIAKRNLELCFPEWGQDQIKKCLKQNIKLSIQTLLDRAWLWFGSHKSIEQHIPLKGESLLKIPGPIMVLCPHFLAIDAAGTRLSMVRQMGCFYRAAKNKSFDQLMREGRSRFNHTDLHEKDEGAKALLSMLSKEIPIFYSNDQDHGITSASFIPFFGISAATIHVLPKLIQKYHLTLLLCIPQLTDTGYQIELTLDSEITRVSQTGDFDSALHLINIWYEKVIRQIPEQYLWMHRRFKTRPPGEPNVYTELLKSQIKRES